MSRNRTPEVETGGSVSADQTSPLPAADDLLNNVTPATPSGRLWRDKLAPWVQHAGACAPTPDGCACGLVQTIREITTAEAVAARYGTYE